MYRHLLYFLHKLKGHVIRIIQFEKVFMKLSVLIFVGFNYLFNIVLSVLLF